MVTLGLKSRGLGLATLRERTPPLALQLDSSATVRLTPSSHVLRAAREPIELDDKQANAVAARIELDLRVGAAFTRLQTLQLQTLGSPLDQGPISYGTYQFHLLHRQMTDCGRFMSIPYTRFCS